MGSMDAAVIVGAGECGTLAAQTLRRSGWTGQITLVGAEPLLPYERPPLSKVALTVAEHTGHVGVATEEDFAAADISYVCGTTADAVDRAGGAVELSDGRRLPYDRLLLATGATPRRLALAAGVRGVHYLRTHADALLLRDQLAPGARVCVIGGGFIGLELAASASKRGCAVTVLEMAPRLLGRIVPAQIAAVIEQRHRAAGVDVRCGIQLEQITGGDGQIQVGLAGGQVVDAQVLVVGIGAVPDTALAEQAGLEIENGIRVDARLQTSDPQILAAGDCVSFPHQVFGGARLRLESWRNARDQAVTAAHNMIEPTEDYLAIPWFWTDQYELSLQIAGLPTLAAYEVVRDRPDGVQIRFGLDDDGLLRSASALGHGTVMAKDIKMSEMIMTRALRPAPDLLADPSVNLRTFLR